MGLNLIIIILCVNVLLGFIAFGLDLAYISKTDCMGYDYTMSPVKFFLKFILGLIISAIFGFCYLGHVIKEDNFRYGFRLYLGRKGVK